LPSVEDFLPMLNNYEVKDSDLLIARLSKKRKIILQKKYIECFKVSEIAEQLNISVNTVKDHLRKGREKLRNIVRRE